MFQYNRKKNQKYVELGKDELERKYNNICEKFWATIPGAFVITAVSLGASFRQWLKEMLLIINFFSWKGKIMASQLKLDVMDEEYWWKMRGMITHNVTFIGLIILFRQYLIRIQFNFIFSRWETHFVKLLTL